MAVVSYLVLVKHLGGLRLPIREQCEYLNWPPLYDWNEPPRDKTNKMACAPSEDSDQPGHPPSLTRVFACAQWVAKDTSFLHADTEDSNQTGRMPRLIWVFAGRTCHFVGFVMRRLKYCFYTVKHKSISRPTNILMSLVINTYFHMEILSSGYLRRFSRSATTLAFKHSFVASFISHNMSLSDSLDVKEKSYKTEPHKYMNTLPSGQHQK